MPGENHAIRRATCGFEGAATRRAAAAWLPRPTPPPHNWQPLFYNGTITAPVRADLTKMAKPALLQMDEARFKAAGLVTAAYLVLYA